MNPYVRRRELQRRNPRYRPPPPHECVREVLDETLGVVIFQEQVLQVARHMGGFSAGEADRFRRSLGRRRAHEELDAWRERFLAGAAQRGVPPAVAEKVFGNLAGFAEFGFPKSHGAAFGLLAYQSTWLKQYYAPEFMCALFNQQPLGFYPPHVLTNDARRHGVAVERPDVNASAARCSVELPAGAVRVGLGYVRGVGAALAGRVEAERERSGPYRSLFGFVQRTGLGRRATSRLIRAGAFDSLGLRRRELLWQLGLFTGYPPAGYPRVEGTAAKAAIAPTPEVAGGRQLRLELPTRQDMVALPGLGEPERMAADYDLLGLSPDRHPMQFLRRALGEGVASSRHLHALPAGRGVEVAGLVVCRQRPLTARGIIFLLLEDEYGLINVLVPRELAESRRDVVRMAPFVRARGALDERTGVQRTLVAEAVEEVMPAEPWRMPSGKSWA